MGRPKDDLAGKRFGRWLVLSDSGERKNGGILWRLQCDCGSTALRLADGLKNGDSKSCGCYDRQAAAERCTKHGMYRTPTYSSWASMIARCTNPRSKAYAAYGAVGIGVCAEWLEFEAFHDDMGDRPAGTSIDRIDNRKGYSKENCRWATATEQARNRSYCRWFYFENAVRSLQDIAQMCGLDAAFINQRVTRNRMTIHEAVTIPVGKRPEFCGDYI